MAAKANIEDIYPLTPMQEGMLFHSLNPNTASAYFEQMAYRLHGEPNIELLEKSLAEIMKRHDILRTVFIHEGVKRPMQVVLKERRVDFLAEDISSLKDGERKEEVVEEIKKRDRQRSFVLSKDVLIRVTLVKIADGIFEFIWSHPHIIMDGWCMGIVVSEYLEIYRSLVENRVPALPPVRPFKSYIRWLEKRDMQKSLDYWAAYLEDFQRPVFVPGIKSPHPGKQGYDRKRKAVLLDEEKTAALNKLARENSFTVNTLLQAAWGIVLSRYKGELDVVFGGVVSGRPAEIEGVESIVGLFINTIPVRIRAQGEKKFIDLVRKVQQQAIASEPHHYCPLVKIQDRSVLKRDLVDHIVAFQNFPVSEQIETTVGQDDDKKKQAFFTVSSVDAYEHTSYDFVLLASIGERLAIRFEYNSHVWEEAVVERIAGHLEHVLSQDLAGVEIEKLRFSYKEKEQDILSTFNEDLENE